jgi:hypothetical protein
VIFTLLMVSRMRQKENDKTNRGAGSRPAACYHFASTESVDAATRRSEGIIHAKS